MDSTFRPLNVSGFLNDDEYPFTAIARITSYWGNSAWSGTGSLIGLNDVLTAAHCVYSIGRGGWADRIEIRFSFDPREPPAFVFEPKHILAFTDFDPDGDGLIKSGDGNKTTLGGVELDIAILTLDVPAGNQFGWLGWTTSFNGGNATLVGYPGLANGFLWGTTIHLEQDPIDYVFNFRFDQRLNGASGGPYIVADNMNNYYVVAVHSTSRSAVDIEAHVDILKTWTKINDAWLTPGLDVLRLYNSVTSAHFFTTDPWEAWSAVTSSDAWVFEGFAFGIARHGGDTDVFRFYNTQTGRHFFTASAGEAAVLRTLPEWRQEGVAFKAYMTDAPNRQDVHRFYRPETGAHFYTSDDNEASIILANPDLYGMRYEGVAFYVDLIW